jgi:hypothetical protein
VSIRTLRVKDATDVRKKLRGGPSIFLSVSVPYERQFSNDASPAEREANRAYLATAEPVRIRSAVVALTRTMLLCGVRLVFGAHPSISPMVLDTARDVAVYRNEQHFGSDEPKERRALRPAQASKASVLIFQSAYFEKELPGSTLQLASWQAGVMVLTSAAAEGAAKDARSLSLLRMRESMVSVPNLCAAVFIGGMDGCEQEAQLFQQHAPDKPMYAIASTGSAARKLWQDEPEKYSGTLTSPRELQDNLSYSLVASDILSDLGLREEHR